MRTEQFQPFFIGTYSQTGPYVPQANGEGIISCTLDTDSGHIQKNSVFKEAINATYLAKSPDGQFLFAASDMFSAVGSVRALSISQEGSLTLLSSQSSHGKSTCHIACDQEGSRIFATSYIDAKLATCRFDGAVLSPASPVISYEGSGPNSDRQEQAHVHQAVVDPRNQWVYVCDLGSDKIWIHDLSHLSQNRDDIKSINLPAGYGPRHLVWNAALPRVYVYCELNSHILVYDWDDQTEAMTLLEDNAALPEEFKGEAAGAAIKLHPSNKTLYVSDRGQNSIIVHSIDKTDGRLIFESWFSTGGKTPRDFGIDPTGRWLLAANQDSGSIIPFRLDPETGLPTGETAASLECGTPACILFSQTL